MFQALFDYFYNLFSLEFSSGDSIVDMQFSIGGVSLTCSDYLSFVASLISLSFIIILCCLFVYKIIKLIGGLIR